MTKLIPTLDCSESPQLPNFDVLPLSTELRKAIDELGYTHPTPVQRAVYEPAARGQDLVVQSAHRYGQDRFLWNAAHGRPCP